jgi:hypothetical protein
LAFHVADRTNLLRLTKHEEATPAGEAAVNFWSAVEPQQVLVIAQSIVEPNNGSENLVVKETFDGLKQRIPEELLSSLLRSTSELLEKQRHGKLDFSLTLRRAIHHLLNVIYVVMRCISLPAVDSQYGGRAGYYSTLQYLSHLRGLLLGSRESIAFQELVLPLMVLSRLHVSQIKSGCASGCPPPYEATQLQCKASLSSCFTHLAVSFLRIRESATIETIGEIVTDPNTLRPSGAISHTANEDAQDISPTSTDAEGNLKIEFARIFQSIGSDIARVLSMMIVPEGGKSPVVSPSRFLEAVAENRSTMDALRCGGVASCESTDALIRSISVQQNELMSDHSNLRDSAPPVGAVDGPTLQRSPENPPIAVAPAMSTGFHEQVLSTEPWCHQDQVVHLALLALAHMDVESLSSLRQLFGAIRDAYSSPCSGSFEALLAVLAQHDHSARVPGSSSCFSPSVVELVNVIITIIKPGFPPHVESIKTALTVVDGRVSEVLRRQQPQLSRVPLINSPPMSLPQFVDPATPTLSKHSAGRAGASQNSSFSSAGHLPMANWGSASQSSTPPATNPPTQRAGYSLWDIDSAPSRPPDAAPASLFSGGSIW